MTPNPCLFPRHHAFLYYKACQFHGMPNKIIYGETKPVKYGGNQYLYTQPLVQLGEHTSEITQDYPSLFPEV